MEKTDQDIVDDSDDSVWSFLVPVHLGCPAQSTVLIVWVNPFVTLGTLNPVTCNTVTSAHRRGWHSRCLIGSGTDSWHWSGCCCLVTKKFMSFIMSYYAKLTCILCAGVSSVRINTGAECPRDDKPRTGMFLPRESTEKVASYTIVNLDQLRGKWLSSIQARGTNAKADVQIDVKLSDVLPHGIEGGRRSMRGWERDTRTGRYYSSIVTSRIVEGWQWVGEEVQALWGWEC